jgi:hypothetical protein
MSSWRTAKSSGQMAKPSCGALSPGSCDDAKEARAVGGRDRRVAGFAEPSPVTDRLQSKPMLP